MGRELLLLHDTPTLGPEVRTQKTPKPDGLLHWCTTHSSVPRRSAGIWCSHRSREVGHGDPSPRTRTLHTHTGTLSQDGDPAPLGCPGRFPCEGTSRWALWRGRNDPEMEPKPLTLQANRGAAGWARASGVPTERELRSHWAAEGSAERGAQGPKRVPSSLPEGSTQRSHRPECGNVGSEPVILEPKTREHGLGSRPRGGGVTEPAPLSQSQVGSGDGGDGGCREAGEESPPLGRGRGGVRRGTDCPSMMGGGEGASAPPVPLPAPLAPGAGPRSTSPQQTQMLCRGQRVLSRKEMFHSHQAAGGRGRGGGSGAGGEGRRGSGVGCETQAFRGGLVSRERR